MHGKRLLIMDPSFRHHSKTANVVGARHGRSLTKVPGLRSTIRGFSNKRDDDFPLMNRQRAHSIDRLKT
jgi:hypothetical protein